MVKLNQALAMVLADLSAFGSKYASERDWKKLLRGARLYASEVRRLRDTGSSRFLESSSKTVNKKDGAILETLVPEPCPNTYSQLVDAEKDGEL